MAKKKNSKASKISGRPFHSDICNLATEFKELNPFDILLLHTLRAGMHEKNKRNWRNQDTLASEMGCSRKTVERSGKRLADFNLIEITKIGRKGGGYGGYLTGLVQRYQQILMGDVTFFSITDISEAVPTGMTIICGLSVTEIHHQSPPN